MPVLQGMREFAPGRVSRRFGVEHGGVSHWIPVPDPTPTEWTMDVSQIAEMTSPLGQVRADDDPALGEISCYRIWRLKPEAPPKDLLETSNSRVVWRTQVVDRFKGAVGDVPASSGWDDLVTSVEFHTHNVGAPLEVRRFAIGASPSLRYRSGETREGFIRFTESDPLFGGAAQTSVGFVLDVDGARFDLKIPKVLGYGEDGTHLRGARAAYLAWRVNQDPGLDGKANVFQRGWLHQIYASALVKTAVEGELSLADAVDELHQGDSTALFREVLDVVFQALPTEEEGSFQDQRLHGEILDLLNDEAVLQRLRGLAPSLSVEEDDGAFQGWLADRFAHTFGNALLSAAQALCPELDLSQLAMDCHRLPESEDAVRIWITETTVGGAGMVEQVLDRYTEDPRRFFELVKSALGPGDFEMIDNEFAKIVDLAARDQAMASILAEVREASSQVARIDSSARLRDLLNHRGVALTHPVVAAMNSRLLRPGSNPKVDGFLHAAVDRWKSTEEKLGVEVDSRVMAYLLSSDDEIDQAMSAKPSAGNNDDLRRWRFGLIYGLLWPRGHQVISGSLQSYNPYKDMEPSDRHLVLHALGQQVIAVELGDDGWGVRALKALAEAGAVDLRVDQGDLHLLRQTLMRLSATPVEVGYLLLYPRVDGVRIDVSGALASLSLREFVQ
jgi:hypothetical protein